MKKLLTKADMDKWTRTVIPNISTLELTINCLIADLYEANGNMPVCLDDIIIQTIFYSRSII